MLSPYVYLSVAQKYEILMMKDRGVTREAIMGKYGISKSTYHNIFANREDIIQKFESEMSDSSSTKNLTLGHLENVDSVVIHWYLRCKKRKVQMTGIDIQEKALEINEKLNGYNGFKASRSWLEGFKKRHNISNMEMKDDYPIESELEEAENFTVDFIKFLQRFSYKLENVYNAVYTELIWKVPPEQTCMFNRVKSKKSTEMCGEYVTVLLCANATGCHKLPVLIIGTVPKTNNFERKAFATIYVSNTSGCMDGTIFKQWYIENFLKSLKERQLADGHKGQCLLLLDNVMSRHNISDIYGIDESVSIMIPRINTSALALPMNSGIITCFKRKYRLQLLRKIKPLSVLNTEEEVLKLYKELSIWDCCRIVVDAWSHVEDTILTRSWDGLLKTKNERSMKYIEGWHDDVYKAVNLLETMPGCKECQADDVLHWFHIDNGHDMIMKACADGVLQDYKDNTLEPVDTTRN